MSAAMKYNPHWYWRNLGVQTMIADFIWLTEPYQPTNEELYRERRLTEFSPL